MRGLGQIVCGPQGVGKTSFALEFPKPLSCISIYETGYDEFEALSQIPAGCQNVSLTDYTTICEFIEKSNQKTLVIDGLRGFQQAFFAHLTKVNFGGNSAAFNSFYAGPRRIAPDVIINFFSLLNIKLQKGTHLVILSHTMTKDIDNATGADFSAVDLDIDKVMSSCFKSWIPNVLYMNAESVVTNGKVEATPSRLMYTSFSLQHPAKNKMGLPSFIAMGNSPKTAFDNYWKHVTGVYKT